MKKSLIIALVGIIMFAFASCGDGTKSQKESKEFAATKAYIEKFEKAVSEATTCDELEAVGEQMEAEAWGLAMQDYEEGDRVTEAEEEELTKLAERWLESIQKKVEELGCEEVEEDIVEVE